MHAMSGNDDYVTSDDDDHAEKKYARPVFIKKSKREAQARSLEGVGHPGDRPVKQTQGHDEEVQKTTIRLVPMAMDRPQSRPKKKRQRTSPTSLGTALFEYGESIAGYKCVTTEGERDRLKQKRERESESESESESEVDVSAFDQAKDTEAEAETERAIRQYWRRPRAEPAVLPLPGTPTLAAASVDQISEHSVERFYAMSIPLVAANRMELLRRDRIRWHPDKHRHYHAKVTKLFQLVNGLWEREQELHQARRRRPGA
ncbi:hypothetical protein N7582_003568 [Saccharomyces uvarum]|uniref:Uncharacterized protein n=1 Tax=Saccharomyces uvarum TaxID=230603 RepID=A0AA35J478_SACUV|nr:hypothetical protein N7582_003568 [Saccharomyces uvarum]CAI4045519.1 hypothetical protein SUVC_11G2540 [Saccharomyces uvarum]